MYVQALFLACPLKLARAPESTRHEEETLCSIAQSGGAYAAALEMESSRTIDRETLLADIQ